MMHPRTPALTIAIGAAALLSTAAQGVIPDVPPSALDQVAPPPGLMPVEDPRFSVAVVRDVAPAGAPDVVAPYPPTQRVFDETCGRAAPNPPRPPVNLVRWNLDETLGFPDAGVDIYRCCDPVATGDWEKLNLNAVRPPKTAGEGQAFVTGGGTMPDGRPMVGPRLDAPGWAAICHLLEDAQQISIGCADGASPPAGAVDVQELSLAEAGLTSTKLLQLVSMRAEVATTLGLYWVDSEPGTLGCRYRVVGHWSDTNREAISGPAGPGLLSAPGDVMGAVMPPGGGWTCESLGGPGVDPPLVSDLGVQLGWAMPPALLRLPAPQAAVAYNICRQGPAGGPFRQINTDTFTSGEDSWPVETPVVVPLVPITDSYGQPLTDAAGLPRTRWPEIFWTDTFDGANRPGGPWTYRVTAMDMFGRESLPSAPSEPQTVGDPFPPDPPTNVGAVTTSVTPPPVDGPPRSEVTIRFDWTAPQHEASPDIYEFRVYRRKTVADLRLGEHDCPIPPHEDLTSGTWEPVGEPIPAAGPHQLLTATSWEEDGETVSDARLEGVLPVKRYRVHDTLSLGEGAVMDAYHYRVVAFDGPPDSNASAPSAPAMGWVVDNRPATPPAAMTPLFSLSEWDDTVHVHLLWPGPTTELHNVMGYKLLRSTRAPRCADTTECPQVCDDDGTCHAMQCVAGLCCADGGCPDDGSADGAWDQGPSDHRQEDREALLTRSPIPVDPDFSQGARLESLAALSNLWTVDPCTGEPIPAAPHCALNDYDGLLCQAELFEATSGYTQYGQDALPMKATGQLTFYRVMAVSQAGIQESDDRAFSSFSPAVPVRIPDFVAPQRAEITQAATLPLEDAVAINWSAGSERALWLAGAGATLGRADLAAAEPMAYTQTASGEVPVGPFAPGTCHLLTVHAADMQGQPVGAPLVREVRGGGQDAPLVWPIDAEVDMVVITQRSALLAPIHGGHLRPSGGPAPSSTVAPNVGTFPVFGLEPDRCYRLEVYGLDGDVGEAGTLLGSLSTRTDDQGASDDDLLWTLGDATSALIFHQEIGLDIPPWEPTAGQIPVGDGGLLRTETVVGGPVHLRYVDRPPTSGVDYCYALQVQDPAGNSAGWSEPRLARRVDVTAPANPAPESLEVLTGADGITLRWQPPEPGLRLTVKRTMQATATGPWRTLATREPPSPTTGAYTCDEDSCSFVDSIAETGQSYWYRLQLLDAAGNRSEPFILGTEQNP